MDQAVQTFAGTAARASAITEPVEGMVTYLNDSQSLSVNNGTDWTIDRTIQVFADSTARGSAIGTAVEGMYSHLNDTDSLEYYDGSAWISFGLDSGLLSIIPSAVTVSSGTASVSADGTINFSGVSSFTLDNIFSSTYGNYRLVMSFTSSAALTDLTLQWRAGGVTGTGNHNWGYAYLAAGSWTVTTDTVSNYALFFGSTGETGNKISCDIYSPTDSTVRTGFSGLAARNRNVGIISGENQVNSAIDGMLISTTSGTISGKLKIYGYN
jgi:hypothetical protein